MKLSLAFLTINGFLCAYGYNGHYFGAEKLLNQYCRYRLTFHCLGFVNMKKETLKVIDAYAYCFKQSGTDFDFSKFSSKNSSKVGDKPNFDKTSEEDSSTENDADLEDHMEFENFHSTTQPPTDEVEVDLSRPMYSEDIVRFIKDETTGRINITSCMLKTLKYIDEDEKLQFEVFVQRLKSYKLDSKLEEQILEGYNYCKAVAGFMPSVRPLSALSPNLKEAYEFISCEKQLTDIACMKKEMRSSKQEYELQGLDGFMADLPDDEKMLGVVWSNLLLNTMTKDEEVIF